MADISVIQDNLLNILTKEFLCPFCKSQMNMKMDGNFYVCYHDSDDLFIDHDYHNLNYFKIHPFAFNKEKIFAVDISLYAPLPSSNIYVFKINFHDNKMTLYFDDRDSSWLPILTAVIPDNIEWTYKYFRDKLNFLLTFQ